MSIEQVPFEAVAPNLAPIVEVGERVRPEGIPEDAWVAIQGVRLAAANKTPFSIRDIPTPANDGSRRRAIQSMNVRPTRGQK